MVDENKGIRTLSIGQVIEMGKSKEPEEKSIMSTSSRPTLAKASFRMINFEMRKNDPEIGRNAVAPTVRDTEGIIYTNISEARE
jgi:hypothetical protein